MHIYWRLRFRVQNLVRGLLHEVGLGGSSKLFGDACCSWDNIYPRVCRKESDIRRRSIYTGGMGFGCWKQLGPPSSTLRPAAEPIVVYNSIFLFCWFFIQNINFLTRPELGASLPQTSCPEFLLLFELCPAYKSPLMYFIPRNGLIPLMGIVCFIFHLLLGSFGVGYEFFFHSNRYRQILLPSFWLYNNGLV